MSKSTPTGTARFRSYKCDLLDTGSPCSLNVDVSSINCAEGPVTGTDIKVARSRLAFTQTLLAQVLNVSESTVCRWESRHDPRIDPLYREFLGLLVRVSEGPDHWENGRKIEDACALGGATFALFVVMKIVHNDWRTDVVTTKSTELAGS